MVQGVDASGGAMVLGDNGSLVQDGSGCQWFSNSVCQWFRVLMVLGGEGSKVAMVLGGDGSLVQDVSGCSDCQDVEQLQADSDGCTSKGVSRSGSSGGSSGQWFQWCFQWWVQQCWWFPVVSGSSDGVVLQAQLSAATAVKTTLPVAPSRGTAATTTPA